MVRSGESAFASSAPRLEKKVRLQALGIRTDGGHVGVESGGNLPSIIDDSTGRAARMSQHTASYVVDGQKNRRESDRWDWTGKKQNLESNLDFVTSPVPRSSISSDIAGVFVQEGVVVV